MIWLVILGVFAVCSVGLVVLAIWLVAGDSDQERRELVDGHAAQSFTR